MQLNKNQEKILWEIILTLLTQAILSQHMLRKVYWQEKLKVPQDEISNRITELEKYFLTVEKIMEKSNMNFNLNMFKNRANKKND